jgi:predicted MFS family arabinose efflux permease
LSVPRGIIGPVLPASYRQLLHTPHVARALGTSLLARTGMPTAGLAVLLLVVHRTGSYGSAGLVSAVWVSGAGFGGLVSSRLIDRGRSVRRVLLTAAALSAAGLVALSLVETSSTAVLATLTAVAAVTTPPVTPSVRTLWPVLLAGSDVRAAMYSLEATVQELTFIVGPSAAGAAAAVFSPAQSVQLAAVITVAGAATFAGTPGLERLAAPAASKVRPSGLLPLVPLYLAGALLICGLSWVEVGVVGAAGAAGATAAAGLLLAVWSAGSLVGGLLGGARPARRGPARRLVVLLAAVAAAHLALAASRGLWPLGILLVLAGGLVAPALGGIYALVQERAPAGAVAQTFAGLTVFLLGGAALGSALAGAVVDARGPETAFALGALPPALAAFVVTIGLVWRRTGAVPAPGVSAAAG